MKCPQRVRCLFGPTLGPMLDWFCSFPVRICEFFDWAAKCPKRVARWTTTARIVNVNLSVTLCVVLFPVTISFSFAEMNGIWCGNVAYWLFGSLECWLSQSTIADVANLIHSNTRATVQVVGAGLSYFGKYQPSSAWAYSGSFGRGEAIPGDYGYST